MMIRVEINSSGQYRLELLSLSVSIFLTVEQAIHNGAAGAVISSGKKAAYSLHNGFKKCALLEVADTLRALGDLAKFYRNSLPTSFIAVTGSNGKTTTKDMAYHVLGNFKSVSRSRKSFNNFIGVPLTIFETEITHDFCIVEMCRR